MKEFPESSNERISHLQLTVSCMWHLRGVLSPKQKKAQSSERLCLVNCSKIDMYLPVTPLDIHHVVGAQIEGFAFLAAQWFA